VGSRSSNGRRWEIVLAGDFAALEIFNGTINYRKGINEEFPT
jgi:hypothetical protein